jgi:hypothetical protein
MAKSKIWMKKKQISFTINNKVNISAKLHAHIGMNVDLASQDFWCSHLTQLYKLMKQVIEVMSSAVLSPSSVNH